MKAEIAMYVRPFVLLVGCWFIAITESAVAQVSFSCDVQPTSGSMSFDTYTYAVGVVAAREDQQDRWEVQGTATLVAVGSESGQNVGFYLTAAHVVQFAAEYRHQTLLLPFGGGDDGVAFAEVARGKPGSKLDGTADDWAVISVRLPEDVTVTPMHLRATGNVTPEATVMTVHILAQERETESGGSDAVDYEALAEWLAGKPNLKISFLDPEGTRPSKKYSGAVFPQMSGGLMFDGVGYGFGLVAMTDLDWGDTRLVEDRYRQEVLEREQVWYASIRVEDEWVEKLPVSTEIQNIIAGLSDPSKRGLALSELWARVEGRAPISFVDYSFLLRSCPRIEPNGWSSTQESDFRRILNFLVQKFCPHESKLESDCADSTLELASFDDEAAVQRAIFVLNEFSIASGDELRLPTPADLVGTELLEPFREACQGSAAPETCLLSASTALARVEYRYAEEILQGELARGLLEEPVYVAYFDPWRSNASGRWLGGFAQNEQLANIAADLTSVQNALAATGELEATARAFQSIEQGHRLGLSPERTAELNREALAAGRVAAMLQSPTDLEMQIMDWLRAGQPDWPSVAAPEWQSQPGGQKGWLGDMAPEWQWQDWPGYTAPEWQSQPGGQKGWLSDMAPEWQWQVWPGYTAPEWQSQPGVQKSWPDHTVLGWRPQLEGQLNWPSVSAPEWQWLPQDEPNSSGG